MEKYKKYLNNNYKFGKVTFAAILCAIFVISNFYGFVYEVIFYYFNGGMKDIYWRGGCFGPWIIIYGIGALLIYFTAYKRRKKPLEVFLLSGLGCGALEFLTGASFYYLMDGTRHWDYNTEILNFGNIGGFVCLRSVLVFAPPSTYPKLLNELCTSISSPVFTPKSSSPFIISCFVTIFINLIYIPLLFQQPQYHRQQAFPKPMIH